MEMKSRRECPASQRGKRPLREAEKKERQRERGRGKRSRARGVSGRRRGPSTGADARSRVPGATVPLKTCQTVSCSHRAQLLCRHAGCGKVSDEEKDGRARTPHLSVRLGPNGRQCGVIIHLRRRAGDSWSLPETMTLGFCGYVWRWESKPQS